MTIPPPFRCETDAGRVRPIGEIDIATVPEVERHLRELRDAGATDRIVLDLRDVTFMDSSGLRMILRWHEEAVRDRITFGLIPGSPVVERIFDTTRMRDRLTFVEPAGET